MIFSPESLNVGKLQVGKYSKDNWHVHGRVEKDCDGSG